MDERLELAGAVHGVPQFDLGPHTDVLSGCPKAAGMQMLLRGMNPEWLAVDEITSPADLAGIRAGLRLRRAHPCDDPHWLRRGAAGKAPVPGRPRGRDV